MSNTYTINVTSVFLIVNSKYLIKDSQHTEFNSEIKEHAPMFYERQFSDILGLFTLQSSQAWWWDCTNILGITTKVILRGPSRRHICSITELFPSIDGLLWLILSWYWSWTRYLQNAKKYIDLKNETIVRIWIYKL